MKDINQILNLSVFWVPGQDVITDLHAEAEPIPLQLTREDWFGHKVSN